MQKKPNFINRNENKRRYRVIKNFLSGNFGIYAKKEKINKNLLKKAVIEEKIEEEYLNDADMK